MRTILWGALAAALLVAPGVARAQAGPIERGAQGAPAGTIVVMVPVIPYVLLVPFSAAAALGPLASGSSAPFGAMAPGGLGAIDQGVPDVTSSGVTSLGGASPGSLGQASIGASVGSSGISGFGSSSSSLSGLGR